MPRQYSDSLLNELNQALLQIEEWVLKFDDWELADQAQTDGKAFLKFMNARKVSTRFISDLVEKKLGYPLKDLHKKADYETLRIALMDYQSSIAHTELDERNGIKGTAKENVRYHLGE
ncbi:hypothetical protein ACQ4N7_28920 [Nodosilinea sp. AN01ver1]|uniref:hypothetical protein n=1 Tax=Nodosilinea sp. AN01ver1 TaxID=3423362 RepID=UPI003D322A29